MSDFFESSKGSDMMKLSFMAIDAHQFQALILNFKTKTI